MYFLTRYLNNVGIRKTIIRGVKKSQLDAKKGSKGKEKRERKGVSLSLSWTDSPQTHLSLPFPPLSTTTHYS